MFKKEITNHQRNQLDKLYQIIKLRQTPNSEISEDPADCVHHFFKKGESMRWWLPGGISVTAEEHNIFESSDERFQEFEEKIIEQRGRQWFADLTKRKFQIVKYITYQRVLDYLNNKTPDYI